MPSTACPNSPPGRHHRSRTSPPQLSRRRRPNATSAKAASSSATTGHLSVARRPRSPVVYGGTTLKADGTLTGKRLAALVGLRDRARRVLQSQNEGWPEANRDEARRELNRAYDRFVLAYGPINKTTFGETADGSVIRRMPNLVKFREDPDAMLVMSLEDYDEVTGKATKAAIMTKDVVGKTPPITQVDSAEEGLLVSLNQRGTVDLPFIATLYGKPEEQVIAELGDLIFHDPESKNWQTADAYLSGNVRAKLAAAERAGPTYARNVEALRHVQPEDVLPGDIDANLGAPWIPDGDIQAFAADLFHVDPSAVPVAHLKKDAVWSIEADYAAKAVGGRHLRIRHGPRQRHLAAGTGPEHEDRRPSTTRSTTATARSAWSTRRRRWPPAKSKSSSRNASAPGCSPIPTAPSGWCGSTTTPTTICVPACSTARTSISPA